MEARRVDGVGRPKFDFHTVHDVRTEGRARQRQRQNRRERVGAEDERVTDIE
jgi:hypothetical protein